MNYSIETYKNRFELSVFGLDEYEEKEGTLQDMVEDFQIAEIDVNGCVIVREIPEVFEEARYYFSKIRLSDGTIRKYDYRYGRQFRFPEDI